MIHSKLLTQEQVLWGFSPKKKVNAYKSTFRGVVELSHRKSKKKFIEVERRQSLVSCVKEKRLMSSLLNCRVRSNFYFTYNNCATLN